MFEVVVFEVVVFEVLVFEVLVFEMVVDRRSTITSTTEPQSGLDARRCSGGFGRAGQNRPPEVRGIAVPRLDRDVHDRV